MATASSEDAAIVDGLRQFEADYSAVGETMNLDDPRLSAHVTGSELTQVRRAFVAFQSEGEVLRGTITVHPTILAVNGDTATVKDCSVDAGQVVKAATGQIVDGSTKNYLNTVTMTRVDGTWKVSSVVNVGSGCSPDAT